MRALYDIIYIIRNGILENFKEFIYSIVHREGEVLSTDETPEECVVREVKEETGYTLTSYKYRGLVTFVSGNGVTEYMSLFTADGFEGEAIPCNEGVLEWVDKDKVNELNIWEGDKIFFKLLGCIFFFFLSARQNINRLNCISFNYQISHSFLL